MNHFQHLSRRSFMRDLGVGSALLPFLGGLPSFRELRAEENRPPRRLVIMFSPNGTLPNAFWPESHTVDGEGLKLKPILEPLAAFSDQMLILKGVHNKIRGDGDNHMRGMSCLLTATELLPGNIQGGSDTPAGWAGGISIDQEIRRFLQSQES
ncbi:MAG: DUF1552 domain-containing protein, partial [Limisphaerales bacterium]